MSGMKCDICGKGVMFGHAVSHAKNRTKRKFLPNLHMARVSFGAVTKRLRLCTKCLRRAKKEMIEISKKSSLASTVSVVPATV